MVHELFQYFYYSYAVQHYVSCSITAIFFDLFRNDKKYEREVPKIPPQLLLNQNCLSLILIYTR